MEIERFQGISVLSHIMLLDAEHKYPYTNTMRSEKICVMLIFYFRNSVINLHALILYWQSQYGSVRQLKKMIFKIWDKKWQSESSWKFSCCSIFVFQPENEKHDHKLKYLSLFDISKKKKNLSSAKHQPASSSTFGTFNESCIYNKHFLQA